MILLPSNYPPSDASPLFPPFFTHHLPSTHSFFHLIIIPSPRSPLLHGVLELARDLFTPLSFYALFKVPLSLSSRFPVCSLITKPLSNRTPSPSVRHLNSVTCFLPSCLRAISLYLGRRLCIRRYLLPLPFNLSLLVSVHKDGTCLP